MAVLKIYKYPHPILRVPGVDVDPATIPDIQTLIDDMIETMYAGPGAIGLAAPQIGQSVRIFIMDMAAREVITDPNASQLRVLINPVITQQSRNKLMREGCLSFPDYLANIKRATRITYEAYDRDGKLKTYEARDLEAVAVQHEIDHLDGVLMIDRVASLKTDLIRRQNR